MWSDTIRYYLYCNELGRQLIPEPKNYRDGNGVKYTRDTKGKGVLNKSSNTLEFTNEAYYYFIKVNALYGITPDVRVDVWYKDPSKMGQDWTYHNSQGIDITNLEFDDTNKTVKASYTNGGLLDKLNSRINEVYDLIETTSINGDDIGELETVNLSLTGKKIFLRSEVVIETGEELTAPVGGFLNANKDNVYALPYEIKTNADGEQINNDRDNLNSVTTPLLNDGTVGDLDNVGGVLYLSSNRQRTLKLNGKAHFKLKNTESGSLTLAVFRYNNAEDLNYVGKQDLQTINTNNGSKIDYAFSDFEITVQEGESFAIGFYSHTDDGITIEFLEGNSLVITEDSQAPATTHRALTFLGVFKRLMARAFGDSELIKSELLETGELSETLKTNGFFLRQFPDVVNEGTEEERRIQVKTSLKKELDSLECLMPKAYWVQNVENKEVLRIEKLSYTMQDFVGVHYGGRNEQGKINYIPVQKLTRKVLSGNYYSSVTIGSLSTGENYENFYGLTSFCGNATYNTMNEGKGEAYKAVTEQRTGDLDVEITRRLPYAEYPDRDTNMDDSIFIIDAKKVGESYTPRMYQDDFAKKPKNIYSPETAFNLRYSPEILLLNHSYVINEGLRLFPLGSLKFASSNCNSSLITKDLNGLEIKGGQEIPHNLFSKPKIKPMLYSFDMPVSNEIELQINGTQTNGVPNWFGRVAILTENGIEYVRIVDVNTNKKGTHKMVVAI